MDAQRGPAVSAASARGGVPFELTGQQAALQRAVAAFVRREVLPREAALWAPAGPSWPLVQELRARARAAGVYGPHIPPRWGGLGADWRTIPVAFEEAGTSLLG